MRPKFILNKAKFVIECGQFDENYSNGHGLATMPGKNAPNIGGG
jgi:hypothetical protein